MKGFDDHMDNYGDPNPGDDGPTERLEYLRGELRAEHISYGELAELQALAGHIEPGDVELLEAAGVPETAEENEAQNDWAEWDRRQSDPAGE